MRSDYIIRPAAPTDLDRLVALVLALQRHVEMSDPALWRLTEQAQKDLPERLAARLDDAVTRILVAEHRRDGVVGVLVGRVMADERYIPARMGFIEQVFVAEGHRRQGVGVRLVAEICRFFAERGVDDISLRYAVGNEGAVRFWAALGFAPRIVTAGTTRQALAARLGTFIAPNAGSAAETPDVPGKTV